MRIHLSALLLLALLGAVAAQESTASGNYASECTIVLPVADRTSSPSYTSLVASGEVSSSTMTSPSYQGFLDVWCLDDGGCNTTYCGDCDENGIVNILDALLAARYDSGLATLTPNGFSNCNVQGAVEPDPSAAVTILDALFIARFVVGLLLLSCC